MRVKRKLTFINDPGHAWLSVSLADIRALGIAEKISVYSYMSPSRAYLEEDCDASVFLSAAKAAGWEIEIKKSYNNNSWKGREKYRAYKSNPLIAVSSPAW